MFTKFDNKYGKYKFMFQQLVKRNFKRKYKGTFLGMAWSVLAPLLTLLVMRIVFTKFFGGMEHYTTFLFCGNLVFAFFNDSTSRGMDSLVSNADIFSKINVPKYLFLFAQNVESLINFGLTFGVFLIFVAIDGVTFTWSFFLLLLPIISLIILNLGVGLIISALMLFFRDMQYLWSIFTMLLMYASAIFYDVAQFGAEYEKLFLINPVYQVIKYFREIVLYNTIPSLAYHGLMFGTAILFLVVGMCIYKKFNWKFLYYV